MLEYELIPSISSATDNFEPIPFDSVKPLIRALSDLDTEVPIEWLIAQNLATSQRELIGYTLLNSNTLIDGLETFCKFQNLVTNLLTFNISISKNGESISSPFLLMYVL